LDNFKQKINGSVRFFIVPESESGFDDDDFDCYYYKSENDKIDFEQTIFDDIFTQIPMKPLCRKDCKGIILEEKEDKFISETEEKNGQWSAALKNLETKIKNRS
jgi:uncharacterized metal-binding protein YceD (DUF177 family)